MDLSLTEDQELLRNAAREFVRRSCSKQVLLELDRTESGFSHQLWGEMARIGWLGMLTPQEYGGSGSSLTDAAVVFEELGRGPVPGPAFASGVLGTLVLLEAASPEQKRSLLPKVASGEMTLALAMTEQDYGWGAGNIRMAAPRRGGQYLLNGAKLFVQDALAATHLLCVVRTGVRSRDPSSGISLLLVDASASGVSRRALPGFIAGAAEVTFNNVRAPASSLLGEAPGSAWPALERALQKAVPILCAYQVGGCQMVFEMSVEYSRTRQQFGTPIGRFQRVQDHIINIVNYLDAARWTTYEALWKLDSGRPAAASVHLAKAVASEGYLKACDFAHEVHAGIGVSREYGLTLHTKMSRTLYPYLGDPKYHKRLLADALEL